MGAGRKLFGEGSVPSDLQLIDSVTTPSGVIFATYETAAELSTRRPGFGKRGRDDPLGFTGVDRKASRELRIADCRLDQPSPGMIALAADDRAATAAGLDETGRFELSIASRHGVGCDG